MITDIVFMLLATTKHNLESKIIMKFIKKLKATIITTLASITMTPTGSVAQCQSKNRYCSQETTV